MVTVPPTTTSSYTLLTRRLLVFLIRFSSSPQKKKHGGQFTNAGLIWDVASLMFNCWKLSIKLTHSPNNCFINSHLLQVCISKSPVYSHPDSADFTLVHLRQRERQHGTNAAVKPIPIHNTGRTLTHFPHVCVCWLLSEHIFP